MIISLHIANGGEIACRVIRTLRTPAIRTLAVHSDAAALDLTAPIPERERASPFGM